MPYRSASIIVILFGSAFVLALILLGRDLHRAARTGPSWKRKLVAGGLVLLAAIGITSGCGERVGSVGGVTPSGTDANEPIPSGQALEETEPWKHLTTVWREAEQIGSGKRGNYPFDEKGKRKVLDDLAIVRSNLERFRAAGLLSDSEAGLLKQELTLLTTRVNAKRPSEMRNWTCYKLMPPSPAQDSLKRLTDRLPLLEKLAQSETIQPRVVSKVLDTIEKDLAVLDKKQMRDRLPEDRKADAEEIFQKAKSHVENIKTKLEGGPNALQSDRRWRGVVDAWSAAVPLAKSGKSTTAQREAADGKFDVAKAQIAELTEARLLSEAEAKLLLSEVVRLRQRIYRDPPTDSQVVCYGAAFILPASHQSLERLNQRLPLLKQLASEGKVHPAALRKVLGSIEGDIKTLSEADELERLKPEQQAKAQQVREQAETVVAEIKKLLEESE